MRLARQVANRRVRRGGVLRLIGKDLCLNPQRFTGGRNFTKHLWMSLGIEAVGVTQKRKPDLLGIRGRFLLFRKPLPHLLFLPLQPIGESTVLVKWSECFGHREQTQARSGNCVKLLPVNIAKEAFIVPVPTLPP